MCNELYEEAHKNLSGKVPEKALEKMGHPLGRGTTKSGEPGRQRKVKGLRVRLPALPINVQTGKLRDALKLYRRGVGDTQTYVLQVSKNLAPYAKYVLALGGTKRMVTRPFWANLQKSWRRKNFDLLVKMREEQRKP